eukprot:TRINITY_DN4765_c0_g1_i2.p2 TRINITY_DN4765_c0_g1~~TRINITY_DN4765_c0_g1_i2.p2  ORF type:complete len:123 (+),score=26.79 TRINITY_DN4765_c0_g1_i2:48-371(+)
MIASDKGRSRLNNRGSSLLLCCCCCRRRLDGVPPADENDVSFLFPLNDEVDVDRNGIPFEFSGTRNKSSSSSDKCSSMMKLIFCFVRFTPIPHTLSSSIPSTLSTPP